MAFRLPRLKIKIGRAKLTIGAGDLLDPLGALRRNIIREAGRVLERGITIKAERRSGRKRVPRRVKATPHIKGPRTTEPAPQTRRFPWLWVGIGLAVVIGGVVLFLVLKK